MARLNPEPQFAHGTASLPGVLLVNLGTPEAPTPTAARTYLKQFLSDPRVVEIPRAVWLPILHAIILNTRPKRSAERYAAIWTPEGSPLKVYTERQAKMLRGYLGMQTRVPIEVQWAMRYGQPSVEVGLNALRLRGCDRIVVLPLYPQYSSSTTGAVLDAIAHALVRMRNVPAVRFVKHFHDHAGYIGALAQSVRDYWMKTGRPDVLVVSFHGVPRRSLELGDPYHCECHKTARLVAEALTLAPAQYRVTFQSRFGRARWLEPYTADVLTDLGRKAVRRVDVLCPGFASDCLETLEEIGIEGKALFLGSGGKEFHYIPCLNDRDDWLKALTAITLDELHGWLPVATPDDLVASRQRAIGLGASH